MIRPLYLLLSKWWGDEPLPEEPSPRWPKARLLSTLTWSRYFLVGNVIRAGTLSPVLGYAVSNRLALPLFLLLYPLSVHGALIAIELYKQALIGRLAGSSEDQEYVPEPKYPDLPVVDRGKLRLMPFESVRFYRTMGLEVFRALVTWYVDRAMGGTSHVRYMDRSGRRAAVDFAMETSVAESVHAKGAAINTLVLGVIWEGAPLWIRVWLGVWVFAEWLLVLLQRYMRVRVFEALTKRQGRPK